jgi:DNA-directed RNA polymerase subunit RPC12/RpoP
MFNLLPEETKSVQDAIKKQSSANIRCLKCKRDVLAKNVRIEKKEETKYSVGECPICGRTVAKLVGRE